MPAEGKKPCPTHTLSNLNHSQSPSSCLALLLISHTSQPHLLRTYLAYLSFEELLQAIPSLQIPALGSCQTRPSLQTSVLETSQVTPSHAYINQSARSAPSVLATSWLLVDLCFLPWSCPHVLTQTDWQLSAYASPD